MACSRPASSTRCRITPSAVGERQMFPRHTKQTETTHPPGYHDALSRDAVEPEALPGTRRPDARLEEALLLETLMVDGPGPRALLDVERRQHLGEARIRRQCGGTAEPRQLASSERHRARR